MSETRKPRRRWFQFLVSLGMSWVAVRMQSARQEKVAVEEIEKLGALVMYDCVVYESGNPFQLAQRPGPWWLRNSLGQNFFATVVDVDFARSPVTDVGLEHLEGLTQLRRLDLHYTQVVGTGLKHLKGLTRLQTLNLFGTEVTDVGLEYLKGLTRLQTLDLSDTEVTDVGLGHLKGLTRLQTLTLFGTKVTDEGVKRLQQALPNCKIIHTRKQKKIW